MELTLRKPQLSDKIAVIEYKRIWQETSIDQVISGSGGLDRFDNFEDWFEKINRYVDSSIEELAKINKVRQITYLAIVDNKIVGMVGVRPYLNQDLLDSGAGNIGYGVLPTERRKGYATEILRQALLILKDYDLDMAIVGCYKDNIGSKKAIIKNGGIVDKDWLDEEGKWRLRFYVNISSNQENKKRWEINADYWDAKMGDHSNRFHLEIVRPHTEELLEIKQGDFILDIACGNGNFSKRMVELGAYVVAFDFSEKMIELAKNRCSNYLDRISFHVKDATKYDEVISLKDNKLFNKAVANMAIMDIAKIKPLLKAVYNSLESGGYFVFSTHHPCFTAPSSVYMSSCEHQGEAIKGQPILQYYYHRSLSDIFYACFEAGFIIDGFFEEVDKDKEKPIIIIVRVKKI